MKKIKVKMNKLVYLGISILEISKTLMYEFWYDYTKPKYQYNAKLYNIDTDSFIIHVSHKKQKDSLEGSLDRVLFVAELEFPKILAPRLPQHT